MNGWGPAECRRPERMAEIVDHMMKEARRRGWTLAIVLGRPTRAVCEAMVRRACALAERDLARAKG